MPRFHVFVRSTNPASSIPLSSRLRLRLPLWSRLYLQLQLRLQSPILSRWPSLSSSVDHLKRSLKSDLSPGQNGVF